MKSNITLIVARSKNNVIGNGGKLPWNFPEELARFKDLTTGHNLIMGRKTFESIGKVLPNRTNYIFSTNRNLTIDGANIRHGFGEMMFDLLEKREEKFFVIGGKDLFELYFPLAERLIISDIDIEVEGDTTFPDFNLNNWKLVDEIEILNKKETTIIQKTYERIYP
ncbi:MAG: hypothetical protein B6226_06140 [Candidatus Cloacimonetes bacterium 4572_65]|nr:MAG: hypothetical protein B6226_06140 [Candidatus Cloacimonetes bacterium 4572_65]